MNGTAISTPGQHWSDDTRCRHPDLCEGDAVRELFLGEELADPRLARGADEREGGAHHEGREHEEEDGDAIEEDEDANGRERDRHQRLTDDEQLTFRNPVGNDSAEGREGDVRDTHPEPDEADITVLSGQPEGDDTLHDPGHVEGQEREGRAHPENSELAFAQGIEGNGEPAREHQQSVLRRESGRYRARSRAVC